MNVVHFAYQAVPAAPNPGAPAAAPVEGGDGAAQNPGGAMGLPFMLLMFLPLVLVMLWQSRSQQKKQETLLSSLKKGDRVLTQSGLVGRLADIDNRYAKVEIAPGVKVTMLRTSLTGRDADEAAKNETSKPEGADSKK